MYVNYCRNNKKFEVMVDSKPINGEANSNIQEMVQCLKSYKKMNTISNVLICTLILAGFPLFLLTGIIGVGLKVYLKTSGKIEIAYGFNDSKYLKEFSNVNSFCSTLNQNSKIWQITSPTNIERRKNGGASRGINRDIINIALDGILGIKPNIDIYTIKMKSSEIVLLPECMLVINGDKIDIANYSEVQLNIGTTVFIEEGSTPRDANIIGYTWKYVNNNGSPDRRFKDNKQLPRCEYGQIYLTVGDLLYAELEFSNSSLLPQVKSDSDKIFDTSYI